MDAPVLVRWNGEIEAFVPLPHFVKRCNATLVDTEIYRMVVQEERSDISHRHEFAWLKTAWLQLPEDIADLYPSPEHLRKRALIQGGFYTEEIIDAGSAAAALRVAAYVRGHDEFALVIVRGSIVIVRHAMSQSYRSMDRKKFRESKTAIIEIVSAMIGVQPAELEKAQAA